MDNFDTTSTDIVVLDAENTLTDSDSDGTSNAAFGAVCLAAGVAIGTFVVPPVVGFVKNLFSKSEKTVAEEIAEITSTTPTPKEKAPKAS